MSSNLPIIAPSSEGPGSEGGSALPQRPRPKATSVPEPEAPPQSDPGQRLIIDEMAQGGLVYTVIDRASGSVVARVSREELTQLGQKPDYAAGALIRVKA